MGIVYLLGDWEKEGFYKIGVTRGTIEDRIKKLQTGNAGEIYLISSYYTEHPFFTESKLHQYYGTKHFSNEWFQLSIEDIEKFKSYCEQIDEMVESMKDNPFFPKNLK